MLVFGGEMSNHNFEDTLSPFNSRDRADITFAGAAVNRRIREGRFIDVEVEAGGGYQFSDSLDLLGMQGRIHQAVQILAEQLESHLAYKNSHQ